MNAVKIEFDRCKECLYCVTFCPGKVLDSGEKINKQGYFTPVARKPEDCMACGICARMCPEGAICVLRDAEE